MKQLKTFLTVLAIGGNILFMLWVSYNGLKEGFQGTLWEKISYITLMGLLTTNSFLLKSRR